MDLKSQLANLGLYGDVGRLINSFLFHSHPDTLEWIASYLNWERIKRGATQSSLIGKVWAVETAREAWSWGRTHPVFQFSPKNAFVHASLQSQNKTKIFVITGEKSTNTTFVVSVGYTTPTILMMKDTPNWKKFYTKTQTENALL